MVVLWAVAALVSFASAIFLPMALGWKIVNYVFGVFNCLIILGFGWSITKQDKQE